jgi:predicted RNase H-like HicB family nuclease
MNTDVNLIFEAYRNNILGEMALQVKDKTNAEKSLIDAITHGIETRTGDTYLFKGLQGEELKQRVEELVVPIIRDLFQDGVYTGRSSGDLKELENDLLEKLAASNPRAKSQYTARILRSFIASVVDEVEGNVEQGETIEDASEDIADAVVDGAEKSDETAQSEAPGDSEQQPVAAPSDRITTRIEKLVADLVDDSGVLESGVVKDVSQQILDSGGLGLQEGQITGKVKAIVNDLVRKQVFERKGQYLKLGSNFEKFEQGGSDSSVLSDEDLISTVTGYGQRPTSGREFWSGQE